MDGGAGVLRWACTVSIGVTRCEGEGMEVKNCNRNYLLGGISFRVQEAKARIVGCIRNMNNKTYTPEYQVLGGAYLIKGSTAS